MALLCVVGGLAVFSASASATGRVRVTKGTGTISCTLSTTLTFSPPLTPTIGTVVAKGVSEVITVAPPVLGGCTGTANVIPSSGLGTKPIVVKMRPFVLNRVDHAGGCFFYPTIQFALKHAVFDWTLPTGPMSPTNAKLGASAIGADGSGNLGYSIAGTARGSFTGPISIGAYFDAASTLAIQNCESGIGSVASATVDPSQSSVTVG